MSKKNIYEVEVSNDYLAKYNLVEEENANKEIIYGIEIELYDKNSMELKTEKYISKITDSYDKAMEIIKKLAQKDVTPDSLIYVIDEIFDSIED